MTDLIKWPFARKQYPGVNNPRFVSDIVAANEAVLAAIKALAGVNDTDFRIISGIEFVPGIPNTYTAGIYYLNGLFYILEAPFNESNYLGAGSTNILSKPFSDGVSRFIYTTYPGIVSATGGAGFSPQMIGAMDAYRIGNKFIAARVTSALALLADLGTAATRDVGISPGEVMAADDARFLEIYNNVLTLNNTGVFVPTADYEPATKKYVDQSQGLKLLWLGNISSDGATVLKLAGSLTVTASRGGTGWYTITHNIGNINYFATGVCINQSGDLTVSFKSYDSVTNNNFVARTGGNAGVRDGNFQLAIYQYL